MLRSLARAFRGRGEPMLIPRILAPFSSSDTLFYELSLGRVTSGLLSNLRGYQALLVYLLQNLEHSNPYPPHYGANGRITSPTIGESQREGL